MNDFVPARLEMARRIRGMTGTAVAKSVDLSAEWYSKIEGCHQIPTESVIRDLARALEFPVGFFYRPVPARPPVDAFHFRASSRLLKKDEETARALSTVAMELSSWMDDTYRLPAPAIPEIQDLVDGDLSLDAERAAEALRLSWGLGYAPIRNLTVLIESKGARIFSAGGPLKAIDAYSFRDGETPVIFINVHKTAERLRFDLAHELGHLLLHSGSLNFENGKQKEQEANDFASAFLMPRQDVLGSVRRGLLLEDILHLKERWGVSAMALTMRANRLGLISEWVYRTLAQQLASAGFRRSEPGSALTPESSSLLTQLMTDLRARDEGFLELARFLDVRAQDVRDLMLGLVTFALPGDATVKTRSTANLRALID